MWQITLRLLLWHGRKKNEWHQKEEAYMGLAHNTSKTKTCRNMQIFCNGHFVHNNDILCSVSIPFSNVLWANVFVWICSHKNRNKKGKTQTHRNKLAWWEIWLKMVCTTKKQKVSIAGIGILGLRWFYGQNSTIRYKKMLDYFLMRCSSVDLMAKT